MSNRFSDELNADGGDKRVGDQTSLYSINERRDLINVETSGIIEFVLAMFP